VTVSPGARSASTGDGTAALAAAASCAATLGHVHHAGHAEPVTQRTHAEEVGRAPLLDGGKANELLAPGWSCSSAALRRDAGWSAAIPLREGLAETARAYRDAGCL